MKRREFLGNSAGLLALGASGRIDAEGMVPELDESAAATLEAFIGHEMASRHIPGVSAGLVHRSGHMLWGRNFGFADIESNEAMSFDHVQNIASISKTFTTVAAMQQVELGLLDLDQDVNEYLPFELKHPEFPDRHVTARMLMRHDSGLRDGSIYARQYACGDPRVSLGVWVREYFSVGGAFYHAAENFAPWAPGEKYEYCNVSFGLLGHIVENTSGLRLPEYCRRNIFGPLGMSRTNWMISELDGGPLTTPYTWVEDKVARGPSWGGIPLGVIRQDGPTFRASLPDGFVANCAYNHPNYPDGFLRTSAGQMMTWARLWLRDGQVNGVRLLNTMNSQAMFTDDRSAAGAQARQGLTWYSEDEINGEPLWGHTGSDPGVSTSLLLARQSGLAAVVFTNTNGAAPVDFAIEILKEGLQVSQAA